MPRAPIDVDGRSWWVAASGDDQVTCIDQRRNPGCVVRGPWHVKSARARSATGGAPLHQEHASRCSVAWRGVQGVRATFLEGSESQKPTAWKIPSRLRWRLWPVGSRRSTRTPPRSQGREAAMACRIGRRKLERCGLPWGGPQQRGPGLHGLETGASLWQHMARSGTQVAALPGRGNGGRAQPGAGTARHGRVPASP